MEIAETGGGGLSGLVCVESTVGLVLAGGAFRNLQVELSWAFGMFVGWVSLLSADESEFHFCRKWVIIWALTKVKSRFVFVSVHVRDRANENDRRNSLSFSFLSARKYPPKVSKTKRRTKRWRWFGYERLIISGMAAACMKVSIPIDICLRRIWTQS